MNRIESYTPEAEGFEPWASAPGKIIGTGDSSKIKAESPSGTHEQAEGHRQLAQVAQPARDSGRDSEARMVEIGNQIAADKYEHCTADPIFLVEQKIRDYGYDSEYTSDFDWIDSVEGYPIDKQRADRLTKLDDNGRNVDKRYTRAYYQDRWEFVTACLTREGAEAFIRRQKHNLRETRIWVDSLFRNQEMIDVREYLKSKAATPTPEAAR